MADIIDKAARFTVLEIEHQVAAARSVTDPGRASRTECEDCGEAIPEARRKAVPGCTRCVDCQQALEAGGKI